MVKIMMAFSPDPICPDSRMKQWTQWAFRDTHTHTCTRAPLRGTPDGSQPHKLIMQRRDTINSNQFIQSSCQCQADSKCTDGDGARGYVTAKPPSTWLTEGQCICSSALENNRQTLTVVSKQNKGIWTCKWPCKHAWIRHSWDKLEIEFEPNSLAFPVCISSRILWQLVNRLQTTG